MSLSEFKDIVTDLISFLTTQHKDPFEEIGLAFRKASAPALPPVSSPAPPILKEIKPSFSPPQEEKAKIIPKEIPAAQKEPMLALIHKLTLGKPLLTPLSPIVLGCPLKGVDEKAFLEKVAQTLSSFLLPTELRPIDTLPSLLKSPTLRLILAPSSFLESAFSLNIDGKVHQIVGKIKHVRFFSLAELKSYTDNVELKRSLWNSLKVLKVN